MYENTSEDQNILIEQLVEISLEREPVKTSIFYENL